MIALWIGLACLAGLALVFLAWPLRTYLVLERRLAAEASEDQRVQANVGLFKTKLAQLDAAYEGGDLDEENYRSQRRELENNLLDDAGEQKTQLAPAFKFSQAQVRLLGIAAISLLASAALYQKYGAAEPLNVYFGRQAVIEESGGDFNQLVARLEQAVRDNPDQAQGWYLLARSYMSLQRFEQAALALEELMRLEGRKPGILAQQAQAWYFVDQRQLTPRVQTLIDEALAQDVHQAAARGLLGIHAFDQGRYQLAIEHWQKALLSVQDQENEQAIREGIAEAQARLGIQAPAEPQTEMAKTPAVNAPELTVAVEIAAELKAQTHPEDTVFVFARALEGPPMPLAAVKLTVADLPTQITLDNSQAMMPARNLSSVQEVVLSARVAKGGSPQAQSGDLQASFGPVAVTHKELISLEINQVVP
ncbi:cytochrome c-type biogenesis protein CcmH [Allopseudospirillum japonicum]|uniref:Cytochrome c-type biogenesis protein CcmH n=1 Tax=Allopseudospirillum japonicum TaxID=64971 RepID=A0A1H6R509_9GAMM|nr:c-type cytochrome biogenesis protein CcmI [Allopseudospirillum japonicum]SEI46282.1 cytochrome c-type biogenesis protein CcmH [Allopseudospirillum japonicum]